MLYYILYPCMRGNCGCAVMKKVLIILLFFVSLPLLAVDTSTTNFSVHLSVTTVKHFTMSIKPFDVNYNTILDGETVEVDGVNNTHRSQICRVDIATNEKNYYITFSGVALNCTEGYSQGQKFPYRLVLTKGTREMTLDILATDLVLGTKAIDFPVEVASPGIVTSRIFVYAVLTDFNDMLPGTYQATIQVEEKTL